MTGRFRAVHGQIRVSAETACENLHKALPRKRHERGGQVDEDEVGRSVRGRSGMDAAGRAWRLTVGRDFLLICQPARAAGSSRRCAPYLEPVDLDAMLARFAGRWSPTKIAQVNGYDVRIVKLQGEFAWHEHADADEFFLVLGGQLAIQMRDRDVVPGPRELFVVPRGVGHCPRAGAGTAVLLLEPGTVINTGDAGGELTAEVEELA